MGKIYNGITPQLSEWIGRQKIFFVSTAPLNGEGHINCSPKGLDSFRLLSADQVAYQDLTGSGVETIAHVKENGRMVIMFCAFEGPPRIVRFHGKANVITPEMLEYNEVARLFPSRAGTRAYIVLKAERISDSCGYAVPLYEFKGDREVLDNWVAAKGTEGLRVYRGEKNASSIDGLPGLL